MIALVRLIPLPRSQLVANSRPAARYFGHGQVRRMGHMYEALANSVTANGAELSSGPQATWKNLGLDVQVISALKTAYPTISRPTEMQEEFMPAILEGKDVLLKDRTGSGKTFGLALAFLSKVQDTRQGHLSTLFLVPHRDLAHQISSWIQRIALAQNPALDIHSLVQVLVRDQGRHLSEGLELCRRNPPKILIGTPQAIMDVYNENPKAMRLHGLDSVVVDEVDYLIETVPNKDPNKSWYKATLKAQKKLKKHPGVTRQLLDIIYARRKELNAQRWEEAAGDRQARKTAAMQETRPRGDAPQLVMSSATLRRHLNQYLHNESGWLNKDYMVKVKSHEERSITTPIQQGLTHSIVIAPVGDQTIRNIEGAVSQEQIVDGQDAGSTSNLTEDVSNEPASLMDTAEETYDGAESPFNPNAMEAIATAFAIDVPRMALLVIPGSAAVRAAVQELRDMGINALPLDTSTSVKELGDGAWSGKEPKLLVGTTATIRGLDMVDLSHVFVLGAPRMNGKGVDEYVHVAGRAGRFGRSGKVVTFVSNDREAARMSRILSTIGVSPVQFQVFQ